MLKEKFDKLIAANALVFADKADMNRVLEELEGFYELRGSTLLNRKNGQQVMDDVFEAHALSAARPFLSVRTLGRFVPKFVDGRSIDQKEGARSDVQNLVKFYFDRLGLVFKGEHLDKRELREAIATRISEKFLFEAGDDEGRIVFRKFTKNGMFSDPFDPIEVINYYTAQFLDHKRSAEKRDEVVTKIRKNALDRLGFTSESQMNPSDQKELKDSVDRLFAESLVSYTRKKLPVAQASEYRDEWHRRYLHKFGLTDIRLASLEEGRKITANVEEQMKKLNALDDDLTSLEAIKKHPVWEQWSGLTSTENINGVVLANNDV